NAIRDAYLRTMASHRIDYLAGSVELGDFDATSTTTTLSPAGGLAWLPPGSAERTFDRYWDDFVARRDGRKAWENYTPYEWRVVGTFVRLGQRERAWQVMDWFMGHRRPPAWNHWAEVVWPDPATPKFIGDMPHTWVGSDFIRSVLDMFAYERFADSALVVGAGIRPEWVTEAPGVKVEGLHTHFGPLSLEMRRDGDVVRARLSGALRPPPGGIIIRSPLSARPTAALVNGRPAALTPGGEVVVRQAGVEVEFRY
ncbi:MAG TPA: hypothetical protein VFS05_04615, partial [Gemmatimonadaceae bacterium]|nr:hypothetical protein [Gemmatimonadaceae bacterium]